MTQSLHIVRCARMTKRVKLCAEAVATNGSGDFVLGVAAVTMTLLKGSTVVETLVTDSAGVVEFSKLVPFQEMRQYTVRADLQPAIAADYRFRDQPTQKHVEGNSFKRTQVAFAHRMRFHVEATWIALRLVDARARAVTGVTIKLTYPDGTALTHKLTQRNLRSDGSFYLNQIPPGTYRVTLPEIDGELWKPTAAPAPNAPVVTVDRAPPQSVPNGGHAFVPGQSLGELALRYGVTKRQLWEFDSNAPVTGQYRNPETLVAPGEFLQVPSPAPKEVACASGACHHFMFVDMPLKMKVHLVYGGKPAPAKLACDVTIAGAPDSRVETDATGTIEFEVPPGAATATIVVKGWGQETYVLALAMLAPVETALGVRNRLANLGFYRDPPGGDAAAQQVALQKAVKTFQEKEGQPPVGAEADGRVGNVTMEALVKAGGA